MNLVQALGTTVRTIPFVTRAEPDVEERVVQLSRDAEAEHDWADEVSGYGQRAIEQEEQAGAEVGCLAGGQRGTDRYQHRIAQRGSPRV